MIVLLIDIGNTRLKWRYLVGGRLQYGGEVQHGGQLVAERLHKIWSQIEQPSEIWCVTVAATTLAQQLNLWTLEHWQRSVHYVTALTELPGLHNGYYEQAQLGADRWVAMVGAQQLYPGAACVADCGTAVTVDCIDNAGDHLGGVIIPGIQVMPRCVTEHTSCVTRQGVAAGGWLGRDTESCLDAGAIHAVAGAIERIAYLLEARLEQPVVRVITGGDAARLVPLLEGDWHYEPELIFIGLSRLANLRRGGR